MLMVLEKNSRPIKIGDASISCSSEDTLLGIPYCPVYKLLKLSAYTPDNTVVIDNKLTFDAHMEHLCNMSITATQTNECPKEISLNICPLNRRN